MQQGPSFRVSIAAVMHLSRSRMQLPFFAVPVTFAPLSVELAVGRLLSPSVKRGRKGTHPEWSKQREGSCRTLLEDVEDDVEEEDDVVEDFDVVDVWLSRIIVQSKCSFLQIFNEFAPEVGRVASSKIDAALQM